MIQFFGRERESDLERPAQKISRQELQFLRKGLDDQPAMSKPCTRHYAQNQIRQKYKKPQLYMQVANRPSSQVFLVQSNKLTYNMQPFLSIQKHNYYQAWPVPAKKEAPTFKARPTTVKYYRTFKTEKVQQNKKGWFQSHFNPKVQPKKQRTQSNKYSYGCQNYAYPLEQRLRQAKSMYLKNQEKQPSGPPRFSKHLSCRSSFEQICSLGQCKSRYKGRQQSNNQPQKYSKFRYT